MIIEERGTNGNQSPLEIRGQPAVARLDFFERSPIMAKKNTRNTKGRIIEAAWRLFYRQGYDDTTVEEIIAESGHLPGVLLPLF